MMCITASGQISNETSHLRVILLISFGTDFKRLHRLHIKTVKSCRAPFDCIHYKNILTERIISGRQTKIKPTLINP